MQFLCYFYHCKLFYRSSFKNIKAVLALVLNSCLLLHGTAQVAFVLLRPPGSYSESSAVSGLLCNFKIVNI